MRKLAGVLALVLLAAVLTGCDASTGLSPKGFSQAMEHRGCQVEEITDQVTEENCRRAYLALSPDEAEYRYYYMKGASNAEAFYKKTVAEIRDDYDSIQGVVFMEAVNPGEGRFRMEMGDCVILVYQHSSSVVTVNACTASTERVRYILRNMGY